MLTLKFPLTGGGEEHGLNDAGIETFKGQVGHYIARECAQNVCDAAASGISTVKLNFSLIDMDMSDIPCRGELSRSVNACLKFWKDNKKTKEFFENAQSVLMQKRITVLKISDDGTTGLSGDDTDRTGKWYCLVRSGGASNKESGAGGSFGIGKFAPFAASPLRTVLYSTRTGPTDVAFQGVSRLVSHHDEESGLTTQGTGYLGAYNNTGPRFHAIRLNENIPPKFRRNENGTDIYVLGYKNESDWDKQLRYEILKSFWPAILNSKITFAIGEMKIDGNNLGLLMGELSTDKEFDAHLYYQAATSNESKLYSGTVEGIGEVKLYLLAGDDNFPKRIAMTRKTGMVIELKQFRSRIPYAGYLVCSSDEGNELLRSLEPPRHDEWDKARGDKVSKRALDALHAWIREQIKSFNPENTAQSLELPELANLLPDFDDEKDPSTNSSANEPDRDSALTSKPKQVAVRPMRQPRSSVDADAGSEGGNSGSESGSSQGDHAHEVSGQSNDTDRPNPPPDIGGGGDGTPGGSSDRPPKIAMRSFASGDNQYKLVLRSSNNFKGRVQFVSVGDDGRSTPVNIARLMLDGTAMRFDEDGVVSDLILKKDRSTQMILECKDAVRLALNLVIK